jgi:hypothetical protein
MIFKKEKGSIKLESITDDEKALDIAEYSEPLLSIGDDGKYTRTSIEPSGTEESSNKEVNLITQADNQVITATSNNSDELITQEVESPNTEQNNHNDANTLAQACKDLELEPGCEEHYNEYRKAYKTLALKYHPNRCKIPECEPMMKKINAAHEKLNKQTNTTPASEDDTVIEEEASKVLNNNGNLNITGSKTDVSDKRNNSNNQQQLDITNSPNQGGKTKRRKAGKKNKSKRVRFMSRRNRRR